MKTDKFHPIASIFPMLSAGELKVLAEDIKANGLLEPIVIYENLILDGRNRYAACKEAGVKPTFVKFSGEDPWSFVWSKNAERRHLPEGQKAMIRVKFEHEHGLWLARQERANERRSKAAKKQPRIRLSDGRVGFSGTPPNGGTPEKSKPKKRSRTQERAEALYNARPDLAEKVVTGEITLQEASRQRKRDEVKREIPLPDGKFRIICADPPWKYTSSGEGLDQYGPAERHYDAMTISELCSLPVENISADNSVLFLWVTSPMLEDVFKVIKAWGFAYKTSFVWDKVSHNFGHYNSMRHEFLLICTRGSCTPDVDEKIDSVQTIKRSKKHSEKPEEFRNIIDRLYPHGSRIELFARGEIPENWEKWGNE